MPDPGAVDPSVISPVTPTPAGTSPGTAPSTVPMTFDPPSTSTQTEIPNYLSGTTPVVTSAPTPAATPSIAPLSTQSPAAPVATAPPAPAPAAQYPSIQAMSEELKSSGVLLSDIEVKQVADTSPLAHLQPDNLISGSHGPEPAYVVKNQAPATIPLASAGTPTSPSLAATTPGASHMNTDPHQRKGMSTTMKIILFMTIFFVILIVAYLAWQYFTAGAMASYDGASVLN